MILLDTCTLLWLAHGEGLPVGVAERIADLENGIFVSAMSALEIGIKAAKGKLELPMPPGVWWHTVLDHHGIAEVPVDATIAFAATQLPPIHRDPADRVIVATARHLRAVLLTPDPLIAQYPGVMVYWQ